MMLTWINDKLLIDHISDSSDDDDVDDNDDDVDNNHDVDDDEYVSTYRNPSF
jgi:hypothetical protein